MNVAPPFLIFFVGAAAALVAGPRLRAAITVATPLVGLANLWLMDPQAQLGIELAGRQVALVAADRMSMLFGWLFHIMALIGAVYILHTRDRMQHAAALGYAGAGLGSVFAGDLIALFLFWEGLALASAFFILARRNRRAERATLRYLAIQLGSGLLLVGGILALEAEGRGLALEAIALEGLAGWLLFLALGVKCGFPLLHSWITDAYPETTETGAVLMSGFTTKVGIYALARLFPGTEELIWIGAAMAMFPIFYAVIEDDLRRVLAYSMINQLGFMVCGIGIGTDLAIGGALAHAFNDVIFKGLLFMSMGAVLWRTGRMAGSELGGLYRTMPATTGLCIVGAASISAFPLFSGFVSKSIVMAEVIGQGYEWVWLALLFASAGVFHHAGIKIPFFAFFAHDSGLRPREAPAPMLIAMAMAAFLCIFNGVYPWLLYDLLPVPVTAAIYQPYTWSHIVAQCQLLFFSAAAFTVLKLAALYPPEMPGVNLDADWSYRWLLPRAARRGQALLARLAAPLQGAIASAAGGAARFALLRRDDPAMGTASLAALAVLAAVLLFHLLAAI